MDQCMSRPGQKGHASYGLIIYRKGNILCDSLLICYPSQLNGNNTIDGTITSIPYRLRAKKNNVTKECEQKQKDFCNYPKNKHLCSVGHPASIIWHGIMISSEYLNEIKAFNINISLSITDQTYTLNNFSLLNIEFGRKEDIFTRLYPLQIIGVKDKLKYKKLEEHKFDDDLVEEFMANIEKGAYLHKYAGIWTLGLDMLPSSAQRFLHLFVYRGCACKVEAWFKNPTTKGSMLPKTSDPVEGKFTVKDCLERSTDQKHSLGNINKEEKKVNFALWSGNKGESGRIEILDDYENAVLGIYFYQNTINFRNAGNGTWREKYLDTDFLVAGTLMNVTIYLSKYSASISLNSEITKYFNNTFWPLNWWNGRFMKQTKIAKIKIKGDFITITPVFINYLDEVNGTKVGFIL
uniref:Uncharacterized protein n=1 Tax=Meloidogyne hapla TaxID=6305 RepID=A0A1I8AZ68_MELHA